MGWIAYTREGEILEESQHARPVQAGEEGKLLAIAQEDAGRKVAIDLTGGIVFIDYDTIGVKDGYLEVAGFKTMFYICSETIRIAEMFEMDLGEIDEQGWQLQYITPLVWRPIWFTRWANGIPAKVIGAQVTLSRDYGSKNVKKMITIFPDGTIGID